MLLFAGLMRRPAPPIAIRAPPPYIGGCRSAISRSKNGSLLSRAWRSRLDPCCKAGLGRWSREMKTKVAPAPFLLAAAGCAQQPPQPAQSAAPPTTTFAAVQPAPRSAPAPSDAQIAPGRWNVERVRCSDLFGASAEDRAAAAMFYYGYLAAKAGTHIIDVSQIDGNVSKVMGQCAASPGLTVPQAFRQALRSRSPSC